MPIRDKPLVADNFQLGLIASSTPFVTGRPVTLFQNHEIFSSGAVGLALTRKTRLTLDFLDVTKLSNVLTVTKSEGNMVNALDNKNPTQLLLSAIRQSGMKAYASDSLKEEQFSLATLSSNGKVCTRFSVILIFFFLILKHRSIVCTESQQAIHPEAVFP